MAEVQLQAINRRPAVTDAAIDPPAGTHMSATGGRATFTDGPFTEAKATIVSFALIDVRTKEEALELARRFWAVVGEGEGDLRQVYGPDA